MSGARISPCGLYRYTLTRPPLQACPSAGTALFVMLNPSTADASLDDPTIRRCIGFSLAWGFAELVVVNLYAYRATDPKHLHAAALAGVDVVGPDNDDHIRELADCSDLVLCAWGSPGPIASRAKHVRGLIPEAHFLRLNKDGSPGHPLYLPKSLMPQVWS